LPEVRLVRHLGHGLNRDRRAATAQAFAANGTRSLSAEWSGGTINGRIDGPTGPGAAGTCCRAQAAEAVSARSATPGQRQSDSGRETDQQGNFCP
jgi:hypothetical protein